MSKPKHIEKHVEDTAFTETFKRSFSNYGFDVIKSRAIPDVRDGLKPVHRAILIEMITSKLTSKAKPSKVARISGAVIGKWHPHSDTAVEDALAGMASWWKNAIPPIEIKGNGGSVYGDPHAAGRYIEARLSQTGDAYGKSLKPGIVEYEPNFDETEQMPKILPAQLPYLLMNGGDGIAVGVASSIPTHNPVEVVEAFISYMKKPKQDITELLEILQGPDFPTSGVIINKSELPEIYQTGNGKIRMRGRMRYDKKHNEIHIYEIPWTSAGSMNKLVEEITLASMETLDKNKKKVKPKIEGITDVKDHSGKKGIDITIKLKRGVDPEAMMKEIFAKTRMETTVKFNFSALNDRQLKKYNLKSYFKEYQAFQHEITINEFRIEEGLLNKRLNIIKGLIILNTVVDEVIASAKVSKGKAELREVLMTGKILEGVPKKYHKTIKSFAFDEEQAEHIANLPIYKLNTMDTQAIINEGKEIQKQLEYANSIINDVPKRKALIIKRHKEELKNLKKNDFERKTEIIDDEASLPSKLEIPETPLYVSKDKYGYIRIEEKNFEDAIQTTNKSRIGFFDSEGVCWNLHLESAQLTKGNGVLLENLIPTNNHIVGMSTTISDTEKHNGLFIFKDGNMRLTDMRKYMTKSKTTKVSSGKSKFELISVVDVPNDAVGVSINGKDYSLDSFSINGVSGHGKHMATEFEDEPVIEFITDPTLITKTEISTPKPESAEGVAYFKDDKIIFDWSINEPEETSEYLYGINYQELLKTELLFVHNDGTAKRINGKQFEVSTRRTTIQADKKGSIPIYIGKVPDTIVGLYSDGTSKRVKTELISEQGKSGGGVRALYTKKHELESVIDGKDSVIECVSLATQPK